MAMGPVQVLVVGFGPDADFKGEALRELKRLTEQDIVRVIDLLVVHSARTARSTRSRSPTTANWRARRLRGRADRLRRGRRRGRRGGRRGRRGTRRRGHLFDDEEVWYIADAIPEGMTAAIAVLEHRWAIPLRNAIADAGGVALSDKWLHPQDLLAMGAEIGLALDD